MNSVLLISKSSPTTIKLALITNMRHKVKADFENALICNMLSGIIIEDVYSLALDIQLIIEEVSDLRCKILSSYGEADKYLSVNKPDFIISDIKLDQGRTVFDILEKHKVDCPIIFLTAFNDPAYFEDSKQFNSFLYLVKPIDKLTLVSALESLLKTTIDREPTSKNIFFVKVNKQYVRINVSDVYYISTEGNYCIIHTQTQKYLIRYTLGTLIEEIDNNDIIRIHRNFAINNKKIDKIDFPNNECTLIDQSQVFPIGRTYKKEFKQNI